MEATFVFPGMFPPIIKTTPNSPTVCANANTIPVNKDDFIFGSNTLNNVVVFDFPKT